jgi:hypothetical protein
VKFTASSRFVGSPENLCQYDNNCWLSKNQLNSWLCVDFSPQKVCASDYILRCSDGAKPRGWRLDGSNDKTVWKTIDQKEDQICFSSNYSEQIFHCESNEFFSFLGFTFTQKNIDYNDYIQALTFVEFSGKITKSEDFV